jgi:hypothetical protein
MSKLGYRLYFTIRHNNANRRTIHGEVKIRKVAVLYIGFIGLWGIKEILDGLATRAILPSR